MLNMIDLIKDLINTIIKNQNMEKVVEKIIIHMIEISTIKKREILQEKMISIINNPKNINKVLKKAIIHQGSHLLTMQDNHKKVKNNIENQEIIITMIKDQ